MSEVSEIYPLLEKAMAHLFCANQLFIDIEKKLAGIYPPGNSNDRKNIHPTKVASTLTNSMSRRKIKPKKYNKC